MADSEFRRLPPDRRDEYRRIVEYAFQPESGLDAYDEPGDGDSTADDGDELADEPGERFGAFVGDDLASVCKHYDFTASLRGSWVPLAGLAAVSTPPEHRRRGHVRTLVDGSLDRWRGDYPLAALWGFSHEFYRQFGWATATKLFEYTCDAEALASAAADDRAGRFHRVEPDEWRDLRDARDAYALDRTLALRYDEDWWREKVFRASDDGRPYVYAWERDGAVRGYVVASFEGGDGNGIGNRHLSVEQAACVDHDAYRHVLRFLADHDSQVEEYTLYRGDATLLDAVEDPYDLDCEVHVGPMVRVVDVADALSTVPYPQDETADLTLAVTDGTAAWNDGAFDLSVDGGTGRCTRRDDARADGADATVGVGTLSQLVVGYHSVADARDVGDLSVRSERVADRLAALFPPANPTLRTFF